MVDVVVTGDGGRGAGTSTGTYVVPKHVIIYFFTMDGQLLNEDGSDVILDSLCTNSPNEAGVQRLATERKRQYSTVPNYICSGSNKFRDPTGVYAVGLPVSHGPILAIPYGMEKRLSDIIGGGSGGGAIGTRVYWLCCRAKPPVANKTSFEIATTVTDASGVSRIIGGDVEASPSGLKPSQVKKLGNWL
jgi:hypothetical protein